MRRWAIPTGLAAVALVAAGAAIANHVTQVDPATVPTGFLAAHNSMNGIPLAAGAGGATPRTQVDPATVPTGFLAAHNSINEIPLSALARAVTPDGADVF